MPHLKTRFSILTQLRSSAHLFVVLVFLASCAQVVAPGGGPRDTKAPKILKWSPDSAQLNFNSKTIQLDFDEYIQLKELNNQLVISPPFEKNPEIKAKGKSLIIDLSKQELQPNTTYSISFGNALQDLNEGNPKENFKYIFSTGSYIDSLTLKGKVETAFDHKNEKGILVMLYSDASDSAVYKKQADYFGRTSINGSFEINNIKPGKYKIYALKDANSNFKYDGETESIAFAEGLIDPTEGKNILLELFQEAPKKLFIKKYSNPSYGKIVLVFNQGSDSIRVNNLSNDKKGVQEYSELSKHNDTLTYWIKNYDKDSLKLQVSNGRTVIDTLEFKMINKEEALKSKRNPLKLNLLSSPNGNQTYDINAGVSFSFNHPIFQVKTDAALLLIEDSLPIQRKTPIILSINPNNYCNAAIMQADPTLLMEDPNDPSRTVPLKIKLDLKESTKYKLLIPPGTFTDIFGFTNDTIKVEFRTREQKFYGSLALKLNVEEIEGVKYIVQLLNENGTIIRESFVRKPQTLTFEQLYPNKYKVKIIYDTNANDQWDSGDYLKKIQPEKVIYNPELITIRSNWDAEIEWKITGN